MTDFGEAGRLYAEGVDALLDRHAAAVRAGDEGLIAEIRTELVGVIGELIVAAAARGMSLTSDEAAMVFGDPELH